MAQVTLYQTAWKAWVDMAGFLFLEENRQTVHQTLSYVRPEAPYILFGKSNMD